MGPATHEQLRRKANLIPVTSLRNNLGRNHGVHVLFFRPAPLPIAHEGVRFGRVKFFRRLLGLQRA